MSDNIFLIDVCGTMFRSNTTFDFISHYYGQNPKVKLWFSLPYRIYNHFLFRFFHKEPLRHNLISLLNGKSKDELEIMADNFMVQFLKKQEHRDVIQLIEKKRNKGSCLVIVSATIDVIAHAVAKHYNIQNWLATQLDYSEDGICKGTIKSDLLANKRHALDKAGINQPYSGIVTDNYTDLELIQAADEAYLIDYADKKSGWKSIITKDIIKKCHIVKV